MRPVSHLDVALLHAPFPKGPFEVAIDVVQTLADLVATPSVNPMGRDHSGPEYLEHRMTDRLAEIFDSIGLPYERHEVEPKRDNIIALLEGDVPLRSGGQLLMFEAHQDTVPVDGMTIDPWDPQIRDDRMYGRGACDIKGGMSAMLAAVARLAEERPAGMPNIVMACTVNEEHGYSGARAVVKLWQSGTSELLPRGPDAAVVAEPTNLDVVVAHKGAVRWRCRTRGRAAHSARPELGSNAVYHMGHVVAALETYAQEIVQQFPAHPRCGQATLSVGTIRGGLSVNTVPDECVIEIDRRLLPGETGDAARQHVLDYITAQLEDGFAVQHDPPFMDGSTLDDKDNLGLAEQLGNAAKKHGAPGRAIGVPYGTDAAQFAAAGVPTVVFGPGSIDQAHTVDEWLDLGELRLAEEVLYEFGRRGLTTSDE